MANFYSTFFPSEEQIIKQRKLIEETTKKAIKEKNCIVCKHYIYDATVPGFIAYEGDCDMNEVPFFGKKDAVCQYWELYEADMKGKE